MLVMQTTLGYHSNDFFSGAYTMELKILVHPIALLKRIQRNVLTETITLTAAARLALLPIMFQIAGIADSFLCGLHEHSRIISAPSMRVWSLSMELSRRPSMG